MKKNRSLEFLIVGLVAYWIVIEMENNAAKKRLDDISKVIGDMARSGSKG